MALTLLSKGKVILGRIQLCLVGPDVVSSSKIRIRILIQIGRVDVL